MTPLNILGDSIHRYDCSSASFQQSPRVHQRELKTGNTKNMCSHSCGWHLHYVLIRHTYPSIVDLKTQSSKPYMLVVPEVIH